MDASLNSTAWSPSSSSSSGRVASRNAYADDGGADEPPDRSPNADAPPLTPPGPGGLPCGGGLPALAELDPPNGLDPAARAEAMDMVVGALKGLKSLMILREGDPGGETDAGAGLGTSAGL